MTKRNEHEVDSDDLKDGFDKIGPGDARHSEFHSTKADGTPKWACARYGGYEHDWMNCPECVEGYEKSMEEAT